MTITTAPDLIAALTKCTGGEEVEISGNLGAIGINGRNALGGRMFTKPVQLIGDGHIDSLNLSYCGGLSFVGLDIGRALGEGEPDYTILVRLTGCQDMTFAGGSIHGSLDGSALNDGWGLYAIDCPRLTLDGVRLTELNRAVLLSGCDNAAVRHCDMINVREGIDMVAVRNAFISTNRIGPFAMAPGDHTDGIQIWSTGRDYGCENVEILDNLIAGSLDCRPQGIFIRDEASLWKTGAGHKNIAICRNRIGSPLWHGINVEDVDGLGIVDNEVHFWPGGSQTGPGYPVTTSWIGTTRSAVTALTGNRAPIYHADSANIPTPAGNMAAFSTPEKWDKVQAAWLAKYRRGTVPVEPAPEPTPPVVDPVPDPVPPPVVPAPTVDLAALLAIATDARDQTNQAENALGRALYRQDKMIAAIKAAMGAA